MTDSDFKKMYDSLNRAQREAVDTIDGPVLVIAGPGTGKTQLLGARVANILAKTDTPARNVLCLTFTESGAANMRERLARFIGRQAYDVSIGTYHAFGGDIIRRFPQYFTETNLLQPIDSLGKHQIVAALVEELAYDNPLKQTQYHIRDLMETISECKRALLSPDDLRAIAAENRQTFERVNPDIATIFDGVSRMPSKLATALPYFEQVFSSLALHAPNTPHSVRFGSLAGVALQQLQQALSEAVELNSTKPLTAWKDDWLDKNNQNIYCMAGALQNRRIVALADIVDKYQHKLEARNLYDFDDMILRSIHALETHDELRYTLQEQYLYILLDEFQDTNAAQLRLVELLTDNPLSEGRPNVMAVGDDDQAIYAFQGAQYSNMLDFYNLYRDTKVVSLDENYRSHQAILETASNVTNQMSSRLFTSFDGVTKQIVARNTKLPKAATMERVRCASDIAERALVAERIGALVDSGIAPSNIAVLAPKHRILEPLVPYLNERSIPIQYEKRENILESPLVRELITMARLVLALHNSNEHVANALWPEVLSGSSWNIPVSHIWEISWRVHDGKGNTNWTRELIASDGQLRIAGMLLAGLAHRVETEPLEEMLDYLIGNRLFETKEHDTPHISSPIRDALLSSEQATTHAADFYELLSQLTVLRARVREYQATQDHTLRLPDLLALVAAHEAAEEPILHTSPYHQAADAVQLMTVYKAKGLEFDHVFLLSCQDEIWGGSGHSNSNRISLPANLAPIRHSGASEDERLRLFFVAITRAKYGLHFTSFDSGYSGKPTKPLKYLDERETEQGMVRAHTLPEKYGNIVSFNHDKPDLSVLELDWQGRHVTFDTHTQLQDLLSERLAQYQLSPTHLTSFIDLQYAGPQRFFMNTLLRFPSAPTADSQFGNAIHETLEWVQNTLHTSGAMPSLKASLSYYSDQICARKLMDQQLTLMLDRGNRALSAYLGTYADSFQQNDRAEVNFRNENCVVGTARLGGKIDKLCINPTAKKIQIVDYKTGTSHSKWGSDLKLHKYRRQLYCYKILVESSTQFKEYGVTGGRLDFIEPSLDDNEIYSLDLAYTDAEVEETRKLLQAIWEHITTLNFPDTSKYDATLKGVKQFEKDLIAGDI